MRISQQIFPRHVAIVVVGSNAMTASFLMPVSFDPKYIAFSISPKRYTFQLIQKEKYFSINMLEKDQKEIAIFCGTLSGRNVNKLEKLEVEEGKYTKIIDCPISFECEKVFMKEFGDHNIVVGKVLKEKVRKKEFIPLLHYSGDKFATRLAFD